MARVLPSSEYPTMVGENFQIYNDQMTGKCICDPPLFWNDLTISPPCRTIPHKFAQKRLSPPMKSFFLKKVP